MYFINVWPSIDAWSTHVQVKNGEFYLYDCVATTTINLSFLDKEKYKNFRVEQYVELTANIRSILYQNILTVKHIQFNIKK